MPCDLQRYFLLSVESREISVLNALVCVRLQLVEEIMQIRKRSHPTRPNRPICARTISGRDIVRAYVERLPWEIERIRAYGTLTTK
jgi:hypothetical protein